MERTPLKERTKLDYFSIDKFIADGGSCLVYSAHYDDEVAAKHNVIIKECYPYGEKITRHPDGWLDWADEIKREKYIQRAKAAATSINSLENDGELAGNITTGMNNFEENNTFYNIVSANMSENAAVYSDYKKDNTIKEILKTISALTGVIAKLHDKQKLHLDIKPGNFMVDLHSEIDNKIVTLFDVDSLVDADDSGHIKRGQSITYSDGYCAPEITRRDVESICYSSDLFSIGAILYEKIYGKKPDNYALWPVAQFDFSNCNAFVDEQGSEVNPAVMTAVRKILKKTLTLLPSYRFKKAGDLKKALDEAIALCNSPYIVSNIFPALDNFIGREEEITEISKVIDGGAGTVIIQGEGGCGKTQLAHMMWAKNKHKYSVGVYFDYAGGRTGLDFEGLLYQISGNMKNYDANPSDSDYMKKMLKKIAELLNKDDVFILLDNFDMPVDEDQKNTYKDIIRKMYKCFQNADVLITTRSDIKEINDGQTWNNTKNIELEGLPKEQSFKLFSDLCERDISDQHDAYEKLYELERGNTLALSVLARLYKVDTRRFQSINDIYQKLIESQGLGVRRVVEEKTAEDALCSIYDLCVIDGNAKKALGLVYLFRRTDLTDEQIYEMYGDVNGDKVCNLINDLVNAGWVKKADNSYFLHPVVKYTVMKKLSPAIDDYPEPKKYEFYMYFTFEAFPDDSWDYGKYVLVSHFEEQDREHPIDNLVLPGSTPFLGSINPTDSPFRALIVAQKDGYLGYNISIEQGNQFYESSNNAIYAKPEYTRWLKDRSGTGTKLLFLSIDCSGIPDDKNICLIGAGACMYNRNEIITVPSTVLEIGGYAFERCASKMINIPSSVDRLQGYCFSLVSADTTIRFEAIPSSGIYTRTFYDTDATIEFPSGCGLVWENCRLSDQNELVMHSGYIPHYGCNQLINERSGELILVQCKHRERILRISDKVKRIKECSIFHGFEQTILPAGVTEIEEGALTSCREICLSGESERYKIVGDNLIEVDGNGCGTVIHCWGRLPTDDWINCLGDQCFGQMWGMDSHKSIYYEELVLPENITVIADRRCFDGYYYLQTKRLVIHSGVRYLTTSIFRITEREDGEIIYLGTKAQFDMIQKSRIWESISKVKKVRKIATGRTIVCTDGKIVF